MNALLIFTILALASPIFGEEAVDAKTQQKRGVVGVGYGGYLGGYHGLNYGYNGLSHGYLNNPYYLGHSSHGVAPVAPVAPVAHAVAPVAPVAHASPLLLNHGYNHGYNHAYTAPAYHAAPTVRIPYAGYAGFGHNLGYHGYNAYNGW